MSKVTLSEDDLSSEQGIDYHKLRDLLKAGNKWKEADQETYKVMIVAVGKKEGEWFTSEDLLNFPQIDLETIDQLWVKYSNGQFGFSVQKKAFVECGIQLNNSVDDERWKRFSKDVGWRFSEAGEFKGTYKNYDDFEFNPSTSSQGKLPAFWGVIGGCSRLWLEVMNFLPLL